MQVVLAEMCFRKDLFELELVEESLKNRMISHQIQERQYVKMNYNVLKSMKLMNVTR